MEDLKSLTKKLRIKKMEINKDTWHYRLWVSSFHKDEVPDHTDFCRYCHIVFWRLFFKAMIGFVLASMIGFFIWSFYGLGKVIYDNPKVLLVLLGAIGVSVAITALIMGAGWLYMKWLGSDGTKESTTLIGKWFQARKQKVCPLVKFSSNEVETQNGE